jgi:hypothetical protein
VDFSPFMPVPPAVQQARPAEVLPALVAKLVEVEKVELARSAKPRRRRGNGRLAAKARRPRESRRHALSGWIDE